MYYDEANTSDYAAADRIVREALDSERQGFIARNKRRADRREQKLRHKTRRKNNAR